MLLWLDKEFKRIVCILLLICTICLLAQATEFVESSGFYWTDTYVTSNEEAIKLLEEFRGTSGVEYIISKKPFKLSMEDKNCWKGYNDISRTKRTANASFIKQTNKDVWAIFSYSNGKLTYGNTFTIK